MIDAEILQLPKQSNRHNHRFNQLIVGVSGSTKFEVEGQRNTVDAWQACIVPSTYNHYYCGIEENRILVLNLPMGQNGFISPDIVEALFDQAGYLKLDNRLQQLIQYGAREIETYPEDTLLAGHIAASFLHGIHHRQQKPPQRKTTKKLDLAYLDAFIENQLESRISIHQLAQLSHLSPSHFQRLFRESQDISPHQYVLQKRLNKAQQLLHDSSTSLCEIAQQCGFSSQAAMSNSFRKYLNITPGQFRRQ
ncbi:helix-turn-helix domain-containing protein [Alkalimarinus coralli]|uniref:helix-turn-helix domain-containing protein n=1 Tax=Alkalimarinus coralli TaxID=2935863 RepID=UPI00202AE46C|nr:AraC family transcriptional regulator [Alkalimarinus coralli]